MYVLGTSENFYNARTVMIPTGACDSESRRVAVENALNGSGRLITGSYAVARASSAGTTSTASLGAAFRYFTITITGGGTCFFPQDTWLKTNIPTWTANGGQALDPKNLRSTNELFSFPRPNFLANHTSSFIELRSVHTLFIHSPSFGNYS